MLFFGRIVYAEVVEAVYSRSYDIPEDTELFIFGDSHAATGLNPDFIKNSVSLAVLSEPLYYTKYRIQQWYKRKNIKNVILSLSYHNISDKKADEIYGIPFIDRYYYFVLDEKFPVKSVKQYLMYLLGELKFRCGIPIFGKNYFSSYVFESEERFVDMGYYLYQHVDLSKEMTFQILDLLYDKNTKVSEFYIQCIKDIAEYCKENNISLNVISTPLRDDYIAGVPEAIKLSFEQLMEDMITDYNVSYYDFRHYAERDDEYIDADHLNFEGAIKFSKEIAEWIVVRGE